MGFSVSLHLERFALRETFTIARGSRDAAEVLRVSLHKDGATGQGECVPYARYGETLRSVSDQITGLPQGWGRDDLHDLLPAGAARNAVDCALWDWRAKHEGRPVWELAGCAVPIPRPTAFTLSLQTPDLMEQAARRHARRPLLKIKLGTADDVARLNAVRRGAPDAQLIVDANEGWDAETFARMQPLLVAHDVILVEQPLPASADHALGDLERLVPVCADESCHTRADLPALSGKYDAVNIKLDKAGGLTAALELQRAARAEGFGIMVGCMVGTSLAMAPAVVLAQDADVVDLDGPLLLAEDRENPLTYDDRGVHPASPALWG